MRISRPWKLHERIAALRAGWLALAVLGSFQSARAQVCVGGAPYSSGPIRVGLAVGSGSLGLQLTLLTSEGAFARASVVLDLGRPPHVGEGLAAGQTDDAAVTRLGLDGGYQFDTSSDARICAVAGVTRQVGPRLYSECSQVRPGLTSCSGVLNGKGWDLRVGAAAGTAISSSDFDYGAVPFIGGGQAWSRISASGAGSSASATDFGFTWIGGAGLVLRRVTVRPTVLSEPAFSEDGFERALDLDVMLGPRRH